MILSQLNFLNISIMDLKDLEIMDIRTLNKLRKDIIKIDRTIKTVIIISITLIELL